MKMNEGYKRIWLEALRSGKYKQGKGRLLSETGKEHCCIGVLCEVAGIENEYIKTNFNLNREKLELFGLDWDAVTYLADMNDGDGISHPELASYSGPPLSFDAIADWIENNL